MPTYTSSMNGFGRNLSSFIPARIVKGNHYIPLRTAWFFIFFLGSIIGAKAQCSITLDPTVSGCYSTTAGSRATVSVEIGWQNAPAGQYIVVTGPAGSSPASTTVTPGSYTSTGGNGTIVSPQVVAFEIVANAASGLTVSAHFSTTTSCSAVSPSFSAPAACEPTPCLSGQLGGTVFNDFDANGVKSAGETLGLIGVTVKAYDCAGNLVGTTTTDVFGKYAFTGLNAGSYPLRVEFTNLPSVYSQGTMNGPDGRTTVQFVNAPDCSVDLGVLNPVDYCEANPKLALPCYVYGDPLPVGSASGSRDAVVAFDYTLAGTTNMGAMTHMATAAQVGTIWGEAYNKYTQTLFMSATLKRHAGLGPLGLGGIYVSDWTDVNNPITTPWLSVTSLTVGGVNIDVGSVDVNGAGGRGLSTDPTVASHDPEAFVKAAKVGIGGIALSDDGNTLFFTNLFDAQLYKVDITAYNTSGTNPTTATAFNVLGSTSCPGGTMRPWATKYYKGDVYVGAVCDAQTSQSKGDLRAFVYKVNPSTGASTIIFDFPLTYPKGFPNSTALSATGWYPWSDNWTDKFFTAANEAIYPQPILSDLEFDIDGTMILGFGDRNGMQTGYKNYQPTGSSTTQYSGNVGGDILRAYSNGGGTFVLENNAKAGPNIGYGPNNNQGPGFGEYYNDNFSDASDNTIFHAELAQGGLAVRPGSGEVVAVTVDPVDVPLNPGSYLYYTQAGGVRHFNNATGRTNSGYIVYTSNSDPGTFGKATGLGDVVLRCSTPTFLEIGNRVWLDADKDGIQDPCEKPLANVKVAIYKGNTLIAYTTTDANGEYYFSAKSKLINGSWLGTAADTTLLPTTAYTVRFGTDGTTNQFASNVLTVDNGTYQLTTALSTAPTASTINDSNPVVTGGFASATVTTGVLGSVNHTIDAGFYCLTTTASVTAIPATCNGTAVNNNGQINITNIQNADKVFLVAVGSTLPSYTAVGGQPVSASATSFTGLSNPASTSGQSYSVVIYNGPCCYTVLTTTLPQTSCCNLMATVGTPVCNGNTYTVSGTISLTVTPAQAQTLTVRDNGVVQATLNLSSGQTTANFSLTGVSNGSSHTVTVTSSNSVCAATATYTSPIAVSATLTSASVCAGQPVSLTATGGTSYTFTGGIVNTTGVLTFTPTSSTVISVTVGNGSGCTSTTAATVTVNPPTTLPTFQPLTLCQGDGGSFGVSVTGGASAYWLTPTSTTISSGTVTIANATVSNAGTYTLVYTNATGCVSTTTAVVTVNPRPVASMNSVSVCAGQPVSLTATGGTSYTFTGGIVNTTGVLTFTPTSSTVISVTVGNGSGCSSTTAATVTVNPLPTATLLANNTTICAGQSTTLTATAGTSYSFSEGTINTNGLLVVSPATTTTYSVTVANASGCVSTTSVTVNVNGQPQIISITPAAVCVGNTASFTVNATDTGSGTLEYSVNGGAFTTGNSFTLNAPASTTATVVVRTQGSSCSATQTVVLNCACQNPASVSLLPTNPQVCAGGLVSLTANVSGAGSATLTSSGTGTFSQNVISGLATLTYQPSAADTQAGSVTLTVSSADPDGSGSCGVAQVSQVLTISPLPSLTVTPGSTSICAGQTGVLTASGANTYLWSNGATTPSISVSATGTYSVTGISSSGCSATASATLTVNPLPTLVTSVICNGLTTYNVSFTATFGASVSASVGTVLGNLVTGIPSGQPVTLTASLNGCSVSTQLNQDCQSNAASLGDYVFADNNKDGIQNTGDTPIAGVVVTLYTNGVVSATTVTDASGFYSFTGLTPGSSLSYSVGFTTPSGYTATLANAGGDDTKDSDANPLTGQTQSVTLAAGEFNPTLDAGFYVPATYDVGIAKAVISSGPYTPGSNVTFQLTVTNNSTVPVYNVRVDDNLPAGVSFVSGAGFSSSGANSVSALVGGPLAANGGSASLTLTAQISPAYSLSSVLNVAVVSRFTSTTDITGLPPVDTNPTNNTATVSVPLVPTASLGDFVFVDINKNGVQDSGEPGIPGVVLVLLDGNNSPVTSTTTNASGIYSFTGLTPGVPYSVSFVTPAGYTSTSANLGGDDTKDSDANPLTGQTQSVTLAAGENNLTLDAGFYLLSPALSIDKFVSLSKAKLGDVLTYTLVLTNSGASAATNVVVRDSSTTGLRYVIGSATAPAGTTFTQGTPVSTWTVASLSAGQSLSLTFQAIVDSTGILYNRASVPGDTANVCTSIPVKVCAGDSYVFTLTAPTGRSSYKWFKDGVELVGQSTNVLSVTAPGSYSLAVDNGSGPCADFSCCPFIVEEDSLPSFQAVAVPVTCSGTTPQANGKLVVSGFAAGSSYQYSLGSIFNASASLSGVAQLIPVGGVLVSNLANPLAAQTYTIRVYNGSGCYRDATVQLLPTVCDCPAEVCVPHVITQTKRGKRIGDPIK